MIKLLIVGQKAVDQIQYGAGEDIVEKRGHRISGIH
jgi:hypothetical protein